MTDFYGDFEHDEEKARAVVDEVVTGLREAIAAGTTMEQVLHDVYSIMMEAPKPRVCGLYATLVVSLALDKVTEEGFDERPEV